MSNPFVLPDKILESGKYSKVENKSTMADDFFIDQKYQGKARLEVPLKKIFLFFFAVFLVVFIFITRVFYLQLIAGDKYYLIAEGNRTSTEFLPIPRGLFYDRNGKVLVENTPKFKLAIDLKNFNNLNQVKKSELLLNVAELTGLKNDEISAQMQKNEDQEECLIDQEIGYGKAMVMEGNAEKYQGLRWQLMVERNYLEPSGLSQILGYLGKIEAEQWLELKNSDYHFFDLIGKAGLELFYEDVLHGQSGRIEKEIDAVGQVLKVINQRQSVPGKDLILTVDKDLNQKIYEILNNYTRQINRPRAAVIASDPRNGEILGLVSLPTFNSNFFSQPQKFKAEINSLLQNENQPLFDRAISGEYPSGSTIKPAMAAGALQEKIINEFTQVSSVGGIQIEQWFFPDWKAGGHGLTNVVKALAESVNTFFYYIGGGYKEFKGLGLEKMVSYLKKFNFGSTLSIDLPGEADGFLPTREWKQETKNEPWYIGDTYHLAIGQGDFLVTPLQINNLTATVANGGIVYKPFLVKEIKDVEKNQSQKIKPVMIKQKFIDEKNMAIIQRGMRQTVLSGSAQSLAGLPVAVAAKTGTAQVANAEPHAWITVFAPYENPEIALTVLIENGGEGSATALPVAREILEWYFGGGR